MLRPIEDKEIEQTVCEIICMTETPPLFRAKLILDIMDSHGYHKGLPSIIEEALNSGDGVYRP